VPSTRIRLVVLAMAGARSTSVADHLRHRFAGIGLDAPVVLESDLLATYFSGTDRPDGYAVIAGTGAGAIRVEGGRQVAVADGLGWLLGDEGSAYWLGREAVRASIAAIGGTGPPTALTGAVSEALLDGPPPTPPPRHRSALIRAVNARPPVALAALAPLVTRAETEGDVVAAAVCDAAAERLIKILADVRDPADPGPLVTAGSVVRDPRSPVGGRLRRLIAARFTGNVLTPTDGVVGAAWLAVRSLDPGRPLTDVHARLRH